jgi:hypothetical protein
MRAAFLLIIALCLPAIAGAQQIMIDRGAKVEGLWVFPSALNDAHYYYIPNESWLVPDENGNPHFSFLRYVINEPNKEAGSQGITQAEGGGILHFLVTYGVPEEKRKRAERALARLNPDRDDLELKGPVIFKEGRYHFISSIVNTESGEEETHVLASGNAPVLEGSQIALSFDLPPERATLLMESLKMATPDISIVFEMTIEGLSDAFEADLRIHWDDVHKHEAFGVKAQLNLGYVGLGADVGWMFDELLQNKSVELETRGANENMEALITKVHTQLMELMFEPVQIDQSTDESSGGSLLSGDKKGPDAYGRAPTNALGGISAGYKFKEMRTTGETVLSLNHQSPVDRISTIGFNVGDLWSRFENDERFFKTVNLADPAFQQREIHVGIDGAILPEFDAYINSVTTVLRKQHQDGTMTVREIVVDRETFNKTTNDFRMIYGWSGDDDRSKWLSYDFRTRWSFKGGGKFETDWATAEANMIDLYAPYQRKVLKIYGESEDLVELGVRVVLIEVDYPFFEDRKKDKLRIRADKPIEEQTLELTLPNDSNEYNYKVTWIMKGGGKVVDEGTDTTGILFIDELPPPKEDPEPDTEDVAQQGGA